MNFPSRKICLMFTFRNYIDTMNVWIQLNKSDFEVTPFSARNILFFGHHFIWPAVSPVQYPAVECVKLQCALESVCLQQMIWLSFDALSFWHLCISAANNVNSSSQRFDCLHIAMPMACDKEEHLSTNQIDMLQAYLHRIMKTAVRYL